jgi:hypothetical protein
VRRFWKREKKRDRAGARAFCLHRTPPLDPLGLVPGRVQLPEPTRPPHRR